MKLLLAFVICPVLGYLDALTFRAVMRDNTLDHDGAPFGHTIPLGASISHDVTTTLFLSHLKYPKDLLWELTAREWRIIYLQRLSVFDQTMSAAVTHYTQRGHGTPNSVESPPPSLWIDPGHFLRLLQLNQNKVQQCQSVLAIQHYLPIIYENDLESPDRWDETIARICEYIDVPPPSDRVTTQLRKPWSRPYREFVSNYDELAELARAENLD